MSKSVTIFGGSGFVGRYIARRMAKAGWRVRVAVRRPNEALFVKTYGTVGQVEPLFCNIRNDASVLAAVQGADAVVNCVGALIETGKNNFKGLHHQGAERVARIAAQQGVASFVHISAIGADADADCNYARTKAEGEAAVLTHMPDAMILRPSVIFGAEDEFFNRFSAMARLLPIVPIFAGGTKFQPVFVDDVANAAALGATGQAAGGIYELGGPEVRTFTQLMHIMLNVIGRRRLVLSLPLFIGKIMGGLFDVLRMLSFGLLPAPITYDQALNLANDNVVTEGAKSFADLGITPKDMESVLPQYLWPYRPSGQYAQIKESAKNLKA